MEINGKKITAVVIAAALIVVILLSLVCCQSGGGEPDPTETTGTTAATTEATREPTSEHTEGSEPTETSGATEATDEPTEETTEATQPVSENTELTEHKHKYSEKVTAATCTERGYTAYTCDCGDGYKDDYTEATGHSWGSWVTTKEPTENAEGKAERSCKNCGSKETKVLSKKVPNHTHKYTEKVTTSATCEKEGVKTFTCSCGDSYTESISKLGHDYGTKVTSPTCTAKGYTTYTCSRCKDSYKANYTDAKGHSYSSKVTTEPTCAKSGVRTYTCSTCKDSYTESVAKVAHKYVDTVTKPTCTADGYTTSKCSVCGDTKTTAGDKATGHSWGSWVTTKEPTTTSTGTAERKCSVCGTTETKTLDKLPESHKHSYSWVVTAEATCTENGSKAYKCECGEVSKTEVITATGHSYSVTSEKAGTCCEAGYKTYTCSKCSDSYTESTGTVDHTWVHHHTDEVGHWEGYYACHCGGWSGTNTDDFVAHALASEDPASHSYYSVDEWVVDTPASDYYKCSVCGATK